MNTQDTSLSPHQLATIAEQISRILSPHQLSELTGLSPTTLWRMRRRGDLPEPIRLSPGRVGWSAAVIEKWLATRGDSLPIGESPQLIDHVEAPCVPWGR